MKKLLLTGAALMALTFTAKAQEIITSFETDETAGYTVGSDISDYSDYWATYGYDSETEVETEVESGVVVVSDNWASDGSQSLYFPAQEAYTSNGTYTNSVYTMFQVDGTYTLSFDFKTNLTDAIIEDESGSNFYVTLLGYDGTSYNNIGYFFFNYDGTFVYADYEASAYNTDYTFSGGENINVKITTAEDGTVTLYLNNEEIGSYAGDEAAVTGTYLLQFAADDWGTEWNVDDIAYNLGVAGTPNVVASAFTVSPNPANSVVTIANADNALVNSVSLTDINGRVVKTASFSGVANAQVNVSDLANGVYMMTISSDQGSVTKKIVKN
jgi:Secretion system C-terminal sorting domain